jgi:hypothetical protein
VGRVQTGVVGLTCGAVVKFVHGAFRFQRHVCKLAQGLESCGRARIGTHGRLEAQTQKLDGFGISTTATAKVQGHLVDGVAVDDHKGVPPGLFRVGASYPRRVP